MRNYTFRKMTREDLPLVSGWLGQPHVRAWWGNAEREIALMKQDMDKGTVDMRIVELVGRPFAYVQDYDVRHYPAPQYGDLPPGARAMDTFLGDPNYLGQGHAAGYINARLNELRRHYPMVAVDPNTTNTRAIGVYATAGFRKRRMASCTDGKLVQVMTYN